jgi:hypothetical protein
MFGREVARRLIPYSPAEFRNLKHNRVSTRALGEIFAEFLRLSRRMPTNSVAVHASDQQEWRGRAVK